MYSSKPWLLSPLFCAINDLSVSDEKDNHKDSRIIENNSLLFNGKKITSAKRRTLFKSKVELAKYELRPDLFYSGDFYGPAIDFMNMTLNLGIKINIEEYINDQPIRFLAKSKSTETIFFIVEFSQINV